VAEEAAERRWLLAAWTLNCRRVAKLQEVAESQDQQSSHGLQGVRWQSAFQISPFRDHKWPHVPQTPRAEPPLAETVVYTYGT
jgi:hypothetical protein